MFLARPPGARVFTSSYGDGSGSGAVVQVTATLSSASRCVVMKPVCVAIEGCCHGELNKIYASLAKNVQLLIICGDFQAIRNKQDLYCMSVPPKYRTMGDFPQYYSGRKVAPVLTVFIGGNHESSSYLRELQYGGWVAPNIYYLGEYGVVWYKGLRIGGMSGIYNHQSFVAAKTKRPTCYTLPYNASSVRSIYHIKPKNYLKILLTKFCHIVLSHDWPQGVWDFGDKARLLRNKPFFASDIESGKLGSPLAAQALAHLRPSNWFSSHLHTLFKANIPVDTEFAGITSLVDTPQGPGESRETDSAIQNDTKRRKKSPDTDSNEIGLDMDDDDDVPQSDPHVQPSIRTGCSDSVDDTTIEGNLHNPESQATKSAEKSEEAQAANSTKTAGRPESSQKASSTFFMALDKCSRKRTFLDVRQISGQKTHPSATSDGLYYDARAIAIQKVVESFVESPTWDTMTIEQMLDIRSMRGVLAELDEIVTYESSRLDSSLKIPANFKKIAPDVNKKLHSPKYWPSNQTELYCKTFGVPLPKLDGP